MRLAPHAQHVRQVPIGADLSVARRDTAAVTIVNEHDVAHRRALQEIFDERDVAGVAGRAQLYGLRELPDAEGLLSYIAQDKKVSRGALTFILTRGVGKSFVARDVPASEVLSFLRDASQA